MNLDNNFIRIDTDAAIGELLSRFDSEYITHVMEDSLSKNIKFRPYNESMPNYPDILNRQFELDLQSAPDYIDKINQVRRDTYIEIINMITDHYNLAFVTDFNEISDNELYGICRLLYDIFVARFTEYMINFFVNYIVTNVDDIYDNIINTEGIVTPKDTGLYSSDNYVDKKFIIIHANINTIIYNIAGYDISFENMINYFVDKNTSFRLLSIIRDNGDIYKNHYAKYLLDPDTSTHMLTCIKLELQKLTFAVNNY